MKPNQKDNNLTNILFGFSPKEKEEEYKYFFYLNIFKSTKNIILITSIIYFVFGAVDIIYNDLNFIVLAIIKVLVSVFGFVLFFSNILEVKRINYLVPIFYVAAMLGIIIQTYNNSNILFFTFYSAGLLAIMSVFLLMSGVNIVNSIISNISVIIIYLVVLNIKIPIEQFYGHLALILMGNIVAVIATMINEKSNRENYQLMKLVEQTNNEKLSNEIKQKQEILIQLQQLNEHNKDLQNTLDELSNIDKQGLNKNDENSKLNTLIQSINEVKNNSLKISDNIQSNSDNSYNIDELKQANYDLSRMINELNESVNNKNISDVKNEQFNLHQFIKDVLLVIEFSANNDKLEFIIDKKCDNPCLINSDQVKLKQIFISLLFYLHNKGIRKVWFSYFINNNNDIVFNFKFKENELKLSLETTLIPTYIKYLGGEYNISDNNVIITLNKKQHIEKENNNYKIRFNKEYVLIIDDDSENLSYIEYVIKNFNATILKATDGIEAINLFKEYNEKIEIVIMDVNMPGLNGNEAAKYMKEINTKVPILLVTAYSHYKEHINNGDRLLLKPFTPKTLVENITELVN